jgi:pyruvate dehydrogenase E2 component (dihydrolipoamide acetyltransferase)
MIIEFHLPELGENITSGDLVSVLVREGDRISPNDSVVEVETEKAVVEIPCPHAGKVAKVHVTKGQKIEVGQLVLSIEAEDRKEAASSTQHVADKPGGEMPAKRGFREPAVPPGELGEDAFGPVRREPVSPARRAIVAQLVKSFSTVPQATVFDDADITEMERLCKSIPPAYLGPTIKLSTMPFVVKAVASALRQHPALNASLEEAKKEQGIVYKQYVNLGVTLDTPRGSMTPILRNVDQMGVLQIARELTLLAARSRSGDFSGDCPNFRVNENGTVPFELRGGTFTVSNLGGIGGTYGTPLVNLPEAAILLLGRPRWLLGIHEGKIEGRLMLPLSLSYDLRVIDAAPAGRFLSEVIDYLQSPGKLLL